MLKTKNDANVIVIGAGSAGLISSYIAAAIKAKVILIEQHKMGGDCLNTGCVPSKALIAAAKAAHIHRKSPIYGVEYALPKICQSNVFEHIHKTIKTIAPNDSAQRYQSLGVDVVSGCAQILDKNTVQVGDKILRAKKIIIASGAAPFIPTIEGIETIEYLTSENLWNLAELPNSIAILGGGPIGCELAQAFARLGVSVTLLERSKHLLNKEDQNVQIIVEENLRSEGIHLVGNVVVTKVEKLGGQQSWQIKITSSAGEFVVDKILIATGRKPNTQSFGLEQLPLKYKANGGIWVNQYMETNIKGIYAIGDVLGPPYQFTHTAEYQAGYAAINALFGQLKKSKALYKAVPAVTFTDPEVARVGLNEKQADKNNIAYDVSILHFDDLDRAIADQDTKGFLKVLTPKGKDKILGATIVASRAGEMLAEFTLAMEHDIGLNKILGTIHPYPSYSSAAKLVAGRWKKMTTPQWVFPILEKFHNIFR